jgi:hypothetical protein
VNTIIIFIYTRPIDRGVPRANNRLYFAFKHALLAVCAGF